MFKRIMSLFLVVILAASVAACGTGSKDVARQENVSYYVETEIGSNSGLISPGGTRVNSKNQLVVFDRGDGTNTGFVTLDQDGNQAGETLNFSGNVRAFTLDEQDNIHVVTAEPANDNTSLQKLTVISPRGDILLTVELGTFSGAGNMGANMGAQNTGFTDIAVDSAGNIYLPNLAANIQVLDKDGKPVKTLGSQGYSSIDIDSDGNIIAFNQTALNRFIEKLDPSTGKSIWSTNLSGQNSGGIMMGLNKVRFSEGDESIYYLTSQGITKYDSSGNLIETVIDFKSYTILASGYNISDMSVDDSGTMYVVTTSAPAGAGRINDSIKYELYKYSLESGDGIARDQQVITVSVPVSNRALEIAASQFQKDNPGYRIDIQTYPSGDYETYLKNLNTQILSGKGPDIISVAGLPYENYISKNILADLSEMIAGDNSFDMNKYYTNIFDALKYNGKLYVLPTNFTFNIIMANQGILDQESITIDDSRWTWDDFKSVAEKVTKKDGGSVTRAALPSVSSMELLSLFTRDSYINYIDTDIKSANFTSQGFIDLLNTVKSFSDGSLTDSNVKNDMASTLEAAGRGSIVFYPFTIVDYNMYGFMKAAFQEQLTLYNIPSAGAFNGGTFTSNSMYAINRNSKYKAESWELLKILLSDEIQSQSMQGGAMQGGANALAGFSVNNAAQQQKAQQAIDASQSGNMRMTIRSGGGSISLSPAPLSQSDIDYINNFITSLNTYANTDANISNIVQDETRAFFSGNKSAEETAKLIQDRVNIYLKE